MREVEFEVCSNCMIDSAFGTVEADGRAKGFPMDKARAGASMPKPLKRATKSITGLSRISTSRQTHMEQRQGRCANGRSIVLQPELMALGIIKEVSMRMVNWLGQTS